MFPASSSSSSIFVSIVFNVLDQVPEVRLGLESLVDGLGDPRHQQLLVAVFSNVVVVDVDVDAGVFHFSLLVHVSLLSLYLPLLLFETLKNPF